MSKKILLIILLTMIGFPKSAPAELVQSWIPIFMQAAGLGMTTIWTIDMIKADKIDISKGYVRAREPGSDAYLLPHWVAEYSTASLLIAGAYGLQNDKPWARDVSLVALGALNYTGMNSLGWVFGKRERWSYAVPILLSLAGSTLSISILL
ncbi:MAG: hypothetical protein K9N35_00320 [Candidatus Marinimicrobia bacterium]|nr:hypothetical protein [Candidatus Neomarinimicrobiota bacterium]